MTDRMYNMAALIIAALYHWACMAWINQIGG